MEVFSVLKKYKILNKILDTAIVAVIRGESVEEGKRIIKACLKGGIKAIEITYTLPNASEIIKELKNENLNKEIIIGAGTVLDETTARLAILSGADFIAGCMTITEITTALKYGVDLIKLFPANSFESNFIKSLKGPFPNINIMTTGGISLDNVENWFKNGATVIGAGGKLASGSDDEIIKTAQDFIKKFTEFKNTL